MIRDALASVQDRIEAACRRAGRDPSEIKLVAVSKTHPAAVVREAIRAGVRAFGENKIQEAEAKITEVGRNAAGWHLIGHLQSNKARKAVQLFDVIHSLDSVALAERLERICLEEQRAELPVLIQVDLAGEKARSGIPEQHLAELAGYLGNCEHLKLSGLMVLPPFFDDPEKARPFFRCLRELRGRFAPGGALSMGMTNDFEVAIEEGATIIRVGTAIFGERPPKQ